MFFKQPHITDGHTPVYGFAHIVDGQQGHLKNYTNQQLSTHQAFSLDPFSDGLVGQNWDKLSCPVSVYVTNLNSSKPRTMRVLGGRQQHHHDGC